MVPLGNFFKKLVQGLQSAVGVKAPPQAALGAFGKHPAWNDHIDPDISLDGRLLYLKQAIYLEGIRDRGIAAWRKANADQLIPYGHLLLWQSAGEDYVVGRLWYSRDGRSRDDFPMVVAAQCVNVSLDWVIGNALPLLERLEDGLKAAKTREEVVARVQQAGAELQSLAKTYSPPSVAPDPLRSLGAIASSAEMKPSGDGLMRVLHVLEDARIEQESAASSLQMRVPRCAPNAADALLLWSRAIEAALDRVPPSAMLAPLSDSWVDVLVGPPDPSQITVLRSSLKLVPLTSDITYSLTGPADDRARALISRAMALHNNSIGPPRVTPAAAASTIAPGSRVSQ